MSWHDALTETDAGCRIALEITPNGATSKIQGYEPWRKRIKVVVTAPAREGAANLALLMLLRDALGLPGTALVLASGEKDGRKIVIAKGFTKAELVRKLEPLL